MMGRPHKASQLLDAAEALFAQSGYGITGVNAIARAADATPMTIYNNFADKDALIGAMLTRLAARFEVAFDKAIAEAQSPVDKVLAIFDVAANWVGAALQGDRKFAGCLFIRAALEFYHDNATHHALAVAHKKGIADRFQKQLQLLGIAQEKAQQLGLDLQLLFDGAVVQAHQLQSVNPALRARQMAQLWLEAAKS